MLLIKKGYYSQIQSTKKHLTSLLFAFILWKNLAKKQVANPHSPLKSDSPQDWKIAFIIYASFIQIVRFVLKLFPLLKGETPILSVDVNGITLQEWIHSSKRINVLFNQILNIQTKKNFRPAIWAFVYETLNSINMQIVG